ncbi:MAG: hydroxymethylglutaryl-CoA lyase [Pseudomonadota bacterium]
MAKVNIVEMGLRDGLQNEAVHLSVLQRFQLLKKIDEAGVRRVELGAFVSPKWVPQMSDTAKLFKKSLRAQEQKKLNSQLRLSALVPNLRGLVDADKARVKEVAVFGAASETFSQKNINCSIKESLQKFTDVVGEAQKKKIKTRAYLSTIFACPYEGKIPLKKVLSLVEKYLELGVYEVSLGDTIGVGSPKQVRALLKGVSKMASRKKIALHFHDTRGTAIANILASLDLGYTTFDTSIGGLGGCPYAPGAAGNVATEDVVYMLNEMGCSTGISLDKLIKTTHWMNRQVGRQLPSKLSLAGY